MSLMFTGIELNAAYMNLRNRAGRVQGNVISRPDAEKQYEVIES